MTPSRWVQERQALAAGAGGGAPADRYIRDGTLLNVYPGECSPANVAIKRERIAYVGSRVDMVGPRTEVISARGRILCPGYVEPHSHPWNLVTPAVLARHVLPLGTTTIFADNLPVYELAGARGFEAAVSALARLPLRFYWWARVHAQSRSNGEARRFSVGTLARLLDNPRVVAVGEITRWPEALEGDRGVLERLALAAARRERVGGDTGGGGGGEGDGGAWGGSVGREAPGARRGGDRLLPRAHHRPGGPGAGPRRDRGHAQAVLPPARSQVAVRGAQGRPRTRLAPHAHHGRLEPSLRRRARVRGSSRARRHGGGSSADRCLPHGHAQSGGLLRAGP